MNAKDALNQLCNEKLTYGEILHHIKKQDIALTHVGKKSVSINELELPMEVFKVWIVCALCELSLEDEFKALDLESKFLLASIDSFIRFKKGIKILLNQVSSLNNHGGKFLDRVSAPAEPEH